MYVDMWVPNPCFSRVSHDFLLQQMDLGVFVKLRFFLDILNDNHIDFSPH